MNDGVQHEARCTDQAYPGCSIESPSLRALHGLAVDYARCGTDCPTSLLATCDIECGVDLRSPRNLRVADNGAPCFSAPGLSARRALDLRPGRSALAAFAPFFMQRSAIWRGRVVTPPRSGRDRQQWCKESKRRVMKRHQSLKSQLSPREQGIPATGDHTVRTCCV
jgi:hypothetical protein